MNEALSDGSAQRKDRRGPKSGWKLFSAPLAGLKTGRLAFVSEINRVRLGTAPNLLLLFQAHIYETPPRIRMQENSHMLDHGLIPIHPTEAQTERLRLEIYLSRAIPWEIEFRQGFSHLEADLRQLQVHSLDVLGSASRSRLVLPQPIGTLYLYISGETSQTTFLTHPGCEVKVHLGQGAVNLTLDHQYYEVLARETRLLSPRFNRARNRYEFCLAGTVDSFTIQNSSD